MIKWVDSLVIEWFDWCLKNNGYPVSSSFYHEFRDQPASCIVPSIAPRPLRRIDRAMRNIPQKHYDILLARYWFQGTEREKAKQAGIDYRTYLGRLDGCHNWIDGFICGCGE